MMVKLVINFILRVGFSFRVLLWREYFYFFEWFKVYYFGLMRGLMFLLVRVSKLGIGDVCYYRVCRLSSVKEVLGVA